MPRGCDAIQEPNRAIASYIGRTTTEFPREDANDYRFGAVVDHSRRPAGNPADPPRVAGDAAALDRQDRPHRAGDARALPRGGNSPARGDRRPLTDLPDVVRAWFEAKGWSPRRHQLDMLELAGRGRSGLLVAA